MKALKTIRRRRDDIGADCVDGCVWQAFGSTRQEARDHAREFGHKVHFVTEETTVYEGAKDPEN